MDIILIILFAPEFFFPNIFIYRFFDLHKIADMFEIDLPSIPKKSNYKARCMYYWSLCEVFYRFRAENELSPAELCAFLYDFAPNFMPQKKQTFHSQHKHGVSVDWLINELFRTTFGKRIQKQRKAIFSFITKPLQLVQLPEYG